MKKILTILLLVVVLSGFSVHGADRALTCKRAVLINAKQVVLEFSEPIAINLHGRNNGPAVMVRMVSTTGGVARVDDVTSIYYGDYLQWEGTLEFLDEKHDRLIWTFKDAGHLGMQNLEDVRNRIGELSKACYDKYTMAFVLAEVPFTQPCTDIAICNITTLDGEVFLTPTLPTGQEKLVMVMETDYGYAVDKSRIEAVSRGAAGFTAKYEGSAVALGSLEPEAEESDAGKTEVVRNDPRFVGLILGTGGLLCLALLLVMLLGGKKRKAVR